MSREIECRFTLDLDNKNDRDFLRRFLDVERTEVPVEVFTTAKEPKTAKKPNVLVDKTPKEVKTEKSIVVEEPKEQTTQSRYTKLQVQEMLAKKNNINTKSALKEKLNSFGASKFSDLKQEDYAEFYQFMETL